MLQITLNAGKRTIELDITKSDDMERLHELLEDVDVFVQGFRSRSLEKRGLGLHDLLEKAARRNKGIIYVDENAYGPDGPFAERPGWQQIGDAASGSTYVMGRSQGLEDGKCVLPPLPASDMITGIVGALGAMIALRDRATKGGSYFVQSSLVAADAIALEKEIGLYPPEVVSETISRCGFLPISPDQYVSEVLAKKSHRPDSCYDLSRLLRRTWTFVLPILPVTMCLIKWDQICPLLKRVSSTLTLITLGFPQAILPSPS